MVFGMQAGAQHWFGRPAKELTVDQAARLTALLPLLLQAASSFSQ